MNGEQWSARAMRTAMASFNASEEFRVRGNRAAKRLNWFSGWNIGWFVGPIILWALAMLVEAYR